MGHVVYNPTDISRAKRGVISIHCIIVRSGDIFIYIAYISGILLAYSGNLQDLEVTGVSQVRCNPYQIIFAEHGEVEHAVSATDGIGLETSRILRREECHGLGRGLMLEVG